VTLEVTPSIATNGLVALDIHQTIEEANGSVTIANVGDVPITRRTERNAKAIVSDRSMLVLDGSLEQNNATRRPGTFKRILTLNGSFHRSKSVTNQNELIVLLRPTILPTPEVAQLSKAEKDRIPALKHTELEIQSEETNRLKQLDKKLKNDRDLERN
jgi:type II secretory pathway component GspD/PulD (secretin)